MPRTVERTQLDINGIAAWRYKPPEALRRRISPKRAALVGAGLLRGMKEGDTADLIASEWTAQTGMPTYGFDPTGSFESQHRQRDGEIIGYSFWQYQQDVKEVAAHVANEGHPEVSLIGYSMAGAAMAPVAPYIEAQAAEIILLKTPEHASDHCDAEQYKRFLRLLKAKRNIYKQFITFANEEPLKGFIDREIGITDIIAALPGQGIHPRTLHVAGLDDGKIPAESILGASLGRSIPRHTVESIRGVEHDTNDPNAIKRLVGLAARWWTLGVERVD